MSSCRNSLLMLLHGRYPLGKRCPGVEQSTKYCEQNGDDNRSVSRRCVIWRTRSGIACAQAIWTDSARLLHAGWMLKRRLAAGISNPANRRLVRVRACQWRHRRQTARRRRRRISAALCAPGSSCRHMRSAAGTAPPGVPIRTTGQQDHLHRIIKWVSSAE